MRRMGGSNLVEEEIKLRVRLLFSIFPFPPESAAFVGGDNKMQASAAIGRWALMQHSLADFCLHRSALRRSSAVKEKILQVIQCTCKAAILVGAVLLWPGRHLRC